jgi:MerR family transcriptional regulator, redox-sensitive transcriptional activator SoxR
MAGMRIGEVARQSGMAASALRYYEKAGLIPPPSRAGKRRQYDLQVLGRIRIIALARDAGFSVRETRTFLHGFPNGTTPALRWREMSRRKIAELDELMARLAHMKAILEASFHCECRKLEDCERYIAAKTRNQSGSRAGKLPAASDPLQRLLPKRPGSCP